MPPPPITPGWSKPPPPARPKRPGGEPCPRVQPSTGTRQKAPAATSPETTTTTTTTTTTPAAGAQTSTCPGTKHVRNPHGQRKPRRQHHHAQVKLGPAAAKPQTPAPASIPVAPLEALPATAISEFQIPPFLIPIYQAAAARYDVPWQLLAAINWIETDFGRDLSISSAGAEGWMQFLPSTWSEYGVDATGSGARNPYNPIDAIFAAARYLAAAGAAKDLQSAIFAYNHAGWYVQSVLARMRAIEAVPGSLLSAVSGLADGDFPVAATARYPGASARAATAASDSGGDGMLAISAAAGAPVVAVGDGQIVSAGSSSTLGRFVVLEDPVGNTYTYAHLGSVRRQVTIPRPGTLLPGIKLPGVPSNMPKQAATAGNHVPPAPRAMVASFAVPALSSRPHSRAILMLTVDLSFHPLSLTPPADSGSRTSVAGSSARSAAAQTAPSGSGRILRIPDGDAATVPLRRGTSVAAGVVLGTIGSQPMSFSIKPAGSTAPLRDPAPVLNGWRMLGSAAPNNPTIASIIGATAGHAATPAQALAMSKHELERVVLGDSRIQIYSCGRGDVEAGRIDRRVLAVLEFLAASGLHPTVSALECGHSLMTESGNISEHSTGDAVDISALNGTSITGHQGPGSITDAAIRLLLTLQGPMKPHQIISLESVPGADNVLSMASHYNHIHIGFRPNGQVGGADGFAPVGAAQWELIAGQVGRLGSPLLSGAGSGAAGSSGND
jgi:murein DD-endopeptidase MepM/ murein hydrolase activator NlpD